MESYFGWHQDESTTREKLLIDINQRQELELNDKNNFKIQARNLRYGQSSGILNRERERIFSKVCCIESFCCSFQIVNKIFCCNLNLCKLQTLDQQKWWPNWPKRCEAIKISVWWMQLIKFFYSAVIKINQSNLNFYHFHLKCSISSWRQSQ